VRELSPRWEVILPCLTKRNWGSRLLRTGDWSDTLVATNLSGGARQSHDEPPLGWPRKGWLSLCGETLVHSKHLTGDHDALGEARLRRLCDIVRKPDSSERKLINHRIRNCCQSRGSLRASAVSTICGRTALHRIPKEPYSTAMERESVRIPAFAAL